MILSRENRQVILFSSGLLSTVFAFGLLTFTLYLIPVLFWNHPFEVPEMIISLQSFYQIEYRFTETAVAIAVIIPFIIGTIVFAFIGITITDYLFLSKRGSKPEKTTEEEEVLFTQDIPNTPRELSKRVTLHFGLKLLLLILCVFLLVSFLEYIIHYDMTNHFP